MRCHPVHLTIWCPVANDEICVAALEVRDDLLRHGVAGDVTLELHDALDGRHWLQVDCHELGQVHRPVHIPQLTRLIGKFQRCPDPCDWSPKT